MIYWIRHRTYDKEHLVAAKAAPDLEARDEWERYFLSAPDKLPIAAIHLSDEQMNRDAIYEHHA